jgi:hypothetical protein
MSTVPLPHTGYSKAGVRASCSPPQVPSRQHSSSRAPRTGCSQWESLKVEGVAHGLRSCGLGSRLCARCRCQSSGSLMLAASALPQKHSLPRSDSRLTRCMATLLWLVIACLVALAAIFLLQDRLLYRPAKAGVERMASGGLRAWPSAQDFRGLVAEPNGPVRGTAIAFHGNAGHAGHRDFYAAALTPLGLTRSSIPASSTLREANCRGRTYATGVDGSTGPTGSTSRDSTHNSPEQLMTGDTDCASRKKVTATST